MLDKPAPAEQGFDGVPLGFFIGALEDTIPDKVHEQVGVPIVADVEVKLVCLWKNIDKRPTTSWQLEGDFAGATIAEVLQHARFHSSIALETSHFIAMHIFNVVKKGYPHVEEPRIADPIPEFVLQHLKADLVRGIAQEWQAGHELCDEVGLMFKILTKLQRGAIPSFVGL